MTARLPAGIRVRLVPEAAKRFRKTESGETTGIYHPEESSEVFVRFESGAYWWVDSAHLEKVTR